jgi:hypothetical protein
MNRRDPKSRAAETLTPQRNFTLTTEDRVRAAASGPPAYIRRLRSIEDLEEGIVRVLVERCQEGLDQALDPEAHARSVAPLRALERLNDLVARHNRWYPIEANLPLHPPTGQLIDRTGQPWRPLSARSLDELLARALERVAGKRPGSLA